MELETLQVDGNSMGRRKGLQTAASSGRYVRAVPIGEGDRSYDIAVDASLRAALLRRTREVGEVDDTPFVITPSDLRKKIYKRPQKTLVVFVVDSSGSMGEGAYARIKAAKGAVLAILARSYQKRHRVGMVAFREEAAEVILQPTSSLTLAHRSLKALPTGGATPFADGLMKAWRMTKTEHLKDPGIRPLLVILSDGEANVCYDAKRRLTEVMEELFVIAGRIGKDNIASIAIDTGSLRKQSQTMRNLSQALGGSYHHISRLKAGGMVRLVTDF